MSEHAHIPVLLEESLVALDVKESGIYIDATYGRGGHSTALLAQLGVQGRLLAIDRDPEAVAAAQASLAAESRLIIEAAPFSQLAELARKHGIYGKVNGILADLGVSSPQLDSAERGFSFQADGPLDMRMDPTTGESAASWLQRAGETEIAQVLRELGEERFARRIAKAIVRARLESPIETTAQLAQLIARAVPTRERGKDPATRSFQAIRIHVNQELVQLQALLEQALDTMAPAGRLAVISFHSLEDRQVKRFMQKENKGDPYPPELPIVHAELKPRLRIVGKPIRPSEAEIVRNPRARSATLRVAENLGVGHA